MSETRSAHSGGALGGPVRRLWRWLQRSFRARFGGVTKAEAWGYRVWGLVGAVIAVPEIWAAAGDPPWPTISGTVGHLEVLWDGVAVIVVALIVLAAAHTLRYSWRDTGSLVVQADGRELGRTECGRFTRNPVEKDTVPAYVYFTVALVCVIAGSALAATLSTDEWILGYVVYGLIGVFGVIVPSSIAYWSAKDVPFPTLTRTIASLERRLHFVAMVILAGLVVLLIHLAFYPWPDIFRQHPTPASQ